MKELWYRIYGRLDRLSKVASKGLECATALFVLASFLTLLFQVLYRFVIVKFFAFSFPFTEEFARYLLIWTVYLLIGVNLREGSMVAISFVYDRTRGRAKTALYFLTRLLMLAFLVIAFIFAVRVVRQNLGFRSSTLRAPGIALFLAPAIGLALIGFETLVEIIGVAGGAIDPFASRGESQVSKE